MACLSYIKPGIDIEACNGCICKPGLHQKISDNEKLGHRVINPSSHLNMGRNYLNFCAAVEYFRFQTTEKYMK